MRIVFVIGSLGLGGAEGQLVVLASGLAHRGHDVHVISFGGAGMLNEQAANGGVTVHHSPKNRVAAILGLPLRVRRLRPDLVHSYLPFSNLLMAVTRWFYRGIPLVWGYRASDFSPLAGSALNRFQDWLSARLASRADLTICNSVAGRNFACGLGYPKDRVRVVSNGIDSYHFRPDPERGVEFRSRYLRGSNGPVVGMLARWDSVKGHEDFLETAARVHRSVPAAQFVAVGRHTEEERQTFLRTAGELGLSDQVVCIPEIPDPAGALNAFDLLVSPSKSEGFPNVVAQAMASGVPVVTTDVGDARFIVGDLCPVVAVGDIEAMATAAVAVLEGRRTSPELLRSAVQGAFSVERLVDKTEELLNSLLSVVGSEDPGREHRVALLGNMNNNHFVLMRYLRDEGIDAHLLLYESDNFLPEADSFDSHEFVHQMRFRIRNILSPILSPSLRRCRRQLDHYGVLVGCGPAPALCVRLGRRLDVFTPYGSDLWDLPTVRSGSLIQRLLMTRLASLQRRGIQTSRAVHMMSSNSSFYEEALDQIGIRGERWPEILPFVYGPAYKTGAQVTEDAGRFSDIRREASFMAFAHGRHFWADSFDPNAKGNERLINGWATFVAREVTPNPFLILFEYGPDVDRTKSLISDLGCEESVLWMESMSRRELMKGLALSDVVCTNFEISFLSSGVNFEALSLSKPIIGYRSAQHLEEELTESIYPILGAREPEEIADQLTWSVQFPDDAAKIGRAGKVWYEHEAERSISRYVNLLKAQRDLSSESPDV